MSFCRAPILIFEPCLTFWYAKVFQAHPVFFLLQSGHQPFLRGALVLFIFTHFLGVYSVQVISLFRASTSSSIR